MILGTEEKIMMYFFFTLNILLDLRHDFFLRPQNHRSPFLNHETKIGSFKYLLIHP